MSYKESINKSTGNKKLLFLLCSVLFAIITPIDFSFAQTSKKENREVLKSMQNEKEINVIIDISDALFQGQGESEFVYRESTIYGDEWAELWENEYKPSLHSDFLGAFNSLMYDFGYSTRFGTYNNSKYQIKIYVKKISGSGHTTMLANIEDCKLGSILYSFSINARGGQYGTKVNLISDGFKRAGKELAIRMNKVFICGNAFSFWY